MRQVPFVLHPRRDDKAKLIVPMLIRNHGHQEGRGLSLFAFMSAPLRLLVQIAEGRGRRLDLKQRVGGQTVFFLVTLE